MTKPLLIVCSCTGVNDSYVLITTPLSWNDAQAYCRANYIDLPSIRNETENEKVHDAANGNRVFIGLYRTRTWSDSSDSSFRHWKSGQPDNSNNAQHCTAMSFSDSGRWTDEDCATSRPFFCYRGNSYYMFLLHAFMSSHQSAFETK